MKKTYFNWSSGKDSALSLYQLQKNKNYKVDRLLTTLNGHYQRVSMHGLKREVLEAQTKSIGLPLDILEIPKNPSMEDYNQLMKTKVSELISLGYTHTAFGDIFLEDLKKYREDMLKPIGIESVFPIWKQPTKTLIQEFLELGFKTVIVCINNSLLDKSFLGREISYDFIDSLPDGIDPCGENGEFHTFCYDGPIFSSPIRFDLGEKVIKTYDDPTDPSKNIKFGFCDIVLK